MTDTIDISYIFKQLEEIQKQSAYLSEAINALSQMNDGDSGDCGAPGNIAGKEKAKALGDVVRCRETTNQRLIQFYEMVYCDLRGLGDHPFVSEAEEEPTQEAAPKQTNEYALKDLLSASKAFAAQVNDKMNNF